MGQVLRRQFLMAASALLLSTLARGQPPVRTPTVGVLIAGHAKSSISKQSEKAFESGLSAFGWRADETIRIEYRYAEGQVQQLDDMARDFVRRNVDVIVARGTSPIRSAKRATDEIPIVMSGAGDDPVFLGLVKSLARPEGNITGLTLLNQDLLAKQLQILRELAPTLSHLALLGSTGNPLSEKGRDAVEAAARASGVQLLHLDVQGPEQLDDTFAEITRAGAAGLLVRADPFVLEANETRVVSLAEKHRLPAIYWLARYVRAGGLMSYGANLIAVHVRSAFYVDRILRGARPTDLPIEEPSRFALAINLKTAKALGLTIPPAIMLQADRVIE